MELMLSLGEFFKDQLTSALKAQNVEVGETTEFYLVNLLTEFTTAQVDEEPLALKIAHAADAPPEERIKTLKEVGDTSLYVSGFFADSLARKSIDVDYYMSMGEVAYARLARLALPEVFQELAAKFPRFVDVLTEIRANTNFVGTSNLLRLYEEWVRTGSEWVEKRLRAAGVFALPGPDRKIH